jgi:hypothetical protein
MSFMKRDQAKPGVSVVADDGFTCIKGGTVLVIEQDEEGELFVPCAQGRHYLDGQLNDDEFVGLTLT